jgi:hypothetical protein
MFAALSIAVVLTRAANSFEEQLYRRQIIDETQILTTGRSSSYVTLLTGWLGAGWPDDVVQKATSASAWGGWRPQKGMIGDTVHGWKGLLLLAFDGKSANNTTKYCVIRDEGTRMVLCPKKHQDFHTSNRWEEELHIMFNDHNEDKNAHIDRSEFIGLKGEDGEPDVSCLLSTIAMNILFCNEPKG